MLDTRKVCICYTVSADFPKNTPTSYPAFSRQVTDGYEPRIDPL